jgi:hypothetical protein
MMAFKVQVGPPQVAIHQGQTVLVSEPNGAPSLSAEPKTGLVLALRTGGLA